MKRLLAALAIAASLFAVPAFAERPDTVEIITVDKEISQPVADAVRDRVTELNENPRVKAVLLDVDTPGGGVLASAEIYEELAKLKVPVVGFCENICASGGMYILMSPSVKYIAIRTQTITGSIGVISHVMRYHRLLDWAKIDTETYKSGISKDTGNPERAVTPEDIKEMQGEVDLLANRFYALVEKGRAGKIRNMTEVKTARVYFGEDGVKAGLADAVMSKEDAIKKAKELSGSKQIFTREELKKMSKDASSSDSYSYTTTPPDMLRGAYDAMQYGVSLIKELHAGANVSIEYRAPFSY